MTALPRERHRRHANPFTVRGPIEVPPWHEVFPRPAPFAVDVGCGPGIFVGQLAAAHPEWNVVGLEIRQHLVASTLQIVAEAQLKNGYALLANASTHLEALFPQRSIGFVSMNFPDPWYKKRHQKRRVLQPDWLDMLVLKMLPGAEFHAMSDYEPIALQMRQSLDAHGSFVNLDGPGRYAEVSTTGLTSEREIVHQRRGEPIYRMRFRYEFTEE